MLILSRCQTSWRSPLSHYPARIAPLGGDPRQGAKKQAGATQSCSKTRNQPMLTQAQAGYTHLDMVHPRLRCLHFAGNWVACFEGMDDPARRAL